MADAPLHIFGIRHHGPGSARSLSAALAALNPDCILVEGPPDAEEVLSFAFHEEMKPPVALLIYDPEKPQRSAFYPYAVFSPEWQAIQFGLSRKLPVRFMDLPQSVQMGMADEAELQAASPAVNLPTVIEEPGPMAEGERPRAGSPESCLPTSINLDPLSHLARAAGYSDSERWWEHMVEHRRDGKEIFGAVLEAMSALREAAIQSSLQQLEPEREMRREAYMRQVIRTAQKEGFQRIAVVCGA